MADQKRTKIAYTIDTGSDGSLMSLNVLKILFPKVTLEQPCKYRQNIVLCTYNKAYIPQLGICSVAIKHKNKQKLCKFSVVPGGGPMLLEMSYIKVLGTLCEM